MNRAEAKKIHIIGAGLSGLFSAYAFLKAGFSVVIYEQSDRCGGLIQTHHLNWGLVETAANGLIYTRHVEMMFEDLGLHAQPMQKEFKKRFIFKKSPRQWPLSIAGTFRLLWGFFYRPEIQPEESVRSYGVRRFGQEATEFLIEPALLGVFGASTNDLDARLIKNYFFGGPQLKPLNQNIKGTVAPEMGMGQLVEGLRLWLEKNGATFILNKKITSIDLVQMQNEQCVLATEATTAAELLREISPEHSESLKGVEFRPLSSLTVQYKEVLPLKGFGCLFPLKEKFNSYGVLFNNCIFKNRSEKDSATWILPDATSSEAQLLNQIALDAKRVFGFQPTVENDSLTRWPKALPLYNKNLASFLKLLKQKPIRNIDLIGNYTGMIGLAKILSQAFELTENIKRGHN